MNSWLNSVPFVLNCVFKHQQKYIFSTNSQKHWKKFQKWDKLTQNERWTCTCSRDPHWGLHTLNLTLLAEIVPVKGALSIKHLKFNDGHASVGLIALSAFDSFFLNPCCSINASGKANIPPPPQVSLNKPAGGVYCGGKLEKLEGSFI